MGRRKNRQVLDTDKGLDTHSGKAVPLLQYMGLEINRRNLYGKDELLAILDRYGGLDSTLDQVRNTYTERFGNQLIWKYPFSDTM